MPVAVIDGAAGVQIIAGEGADAPAIATPQTVDARWWCRRAADAERVATAARRRLRRCAGCEAGSNAPITGCGNPPENIAVSVSSAIESIAHAARALNVALHSQQDIFDATTELAGRVDREIERLRQSGGLRSVNKSYQAYRIETSGRGEKVMRYQEWMQRYRESLVRKLASALRYL